MKKNILLIIFVLLLIPKSIKALEYKEKFKTTLEKPDNGEMFMMNVKETSDGNYIGVSSTTGNCIALKFDKAGTILNRQDLSNYLSFKPISDIIELSNGNFLITVDKSDYYVDTGETFICDKNIDNCNQVNIDIMKHPTGRSIFEYNGHYMIIGASKKNESGEYDLYFYEIDSTGNVINKRTVKKVFHNGYYYGVYSDGKVLYVMVTNGNTFEILEVSENDIKTRTKNNIITDEMYNNITEGTFTEMALDENKNIYFSTRYGIYKFDTDNNLSLIIDAQSNNFDFTSIIYTKNHFIAGGIKHKEENGEELPYAVFIIYDKNFNVVEETTINETFNISSLGPNMSDFSITKQITKTKNGFIASGMLAGKPFVIEYQFPYNIKTETDGNGTIEVLSSGYGGEEITFKVTSPNNLKLSSLIIKTDSGETIEFSEDDIQYNSENTISIKTNRFTMPYDDVTIQARWSSKIINPSTSSFNKLLVLIILIASVTPFIINRKANN